MDCVEVINDDDVVCFSLFSDSTPDAILHFYLVLKKIIAVFSGNFSCNLIHTHA